jgi:hypothetical protein
VRASCECASSGGSRTNSRWGQDMTDAAPIFLIDDIWRAHCTIMISRGP